MSIKKAQVLFFALLCALHKDVQWMSRAPAALKANSPPREGRLWWLGPFLPVVLCRRTNQGVFLLSLICAVSFLLSHVQSKAVTPGKGEAPSISLEDQVAGCCSASREKGHGERRPGTPHFHGHGGRTECSWELDFLWTQFYSTWLEKCVGQVPDLAMRLRKKSHPFFSHSPWPRDWRLTCVRPRAH